MEKKQEILQLFNEVGVKTHSDAWDKVIEEEDWDMIADEIVKLFSMSDVGQRFSQLPKDYKRYAELSFKYTQEGCTDDEYEEHWNLKVKLGGL